jgi:hypothetical protein
VPDLIDGVGLAVMGDLSRRVAAIERSIRALNGPGAEGLAGITRFLLRSEAVASSRIEGIAPSAQQVALAELGQSETVRGISDQAKLVANNMTVVSAATGELVEADSLAVDRIIELHLYVAGLSAYRHMSPAGSAEASAAVNAWLVTFIGAADVAVEHSETLVNQIEDLRKGWAERLSAHRRSVGLRAPPRSDSAVARLLRTLPEAPVVTATTLGRILDISFPAASAALDELRQAGIVSTMSIDRGATAYIAREVLDLVTSSERVPASTRSLPPDPRFSRPTGCR